MMITSKKNSHPRKRLYRVVIGFESLFAADEFTTLEEVLEKRIEEIIGAITTNDCVGIVEEEEYDSLESFERLPGDWEINGIPFSLDESDFDDSMSVLDYKEEMEETEKEEVCGCPFCGAEDDKVEVEYGDLVPCQWQVHCTACGAKGGIGDGLPEVIENWNRLYSLNQ